MVHLQHLLCFNSKEEFIEEHGFAVIGDILFIFSEFKLFINYFLYFIY